MSKQWEVNQILEKREVSGKVEYKVEWKPSWESVDNLNCKELIRDFEKRRSPIDPMKKDKTIPVAAVVPTTGEMPTPALNVGGDMEVVLYECRECPGSRFTRRQKEAHRNYHRRAKMLSKKRKQQQPSFPRSRTEIPNRTEQ